MRWIVILLLMSNGIYFMWQYFLQPPAPAPAAQSRPVAELGAPLVLLSEYQNESGAVAAEAVSLAASDEASKTTVRPVCTMIGPFAEEVTGRQVVSRLAAMDLRPALQTIEVAAEPNYWAYIPPRPTRESAGQLLKELLSKKIDSFLIRQGELENGISLGIFSQRERAEKVARIREAEGYDVEVRAVPVSRSEVWAVFDAAQSAQFSPQLWKKIQQGNLGLERRKNYCDKIAPSVDFD